MPPPLVDALMSGKPLEQAVAEYVRSRPARMVGRMRVMCEALLRSADTAVAGDLGYAMLSRVFGAPEKAWYHFGRVPEEQWRTWAPAEYLRTAAEIGDTELLTAATSLIADRPENLPVEGWLAAAEGAFGLGRYDLARQALARVVAVKGRPATSARVRWLEDWLDRAERREPRAVQAPSSRVAFGVLDYKQPERARTSTSLDDYLQTVAALAQLARHRGLEFAGSPDLVEFMKALAARIDDRMAIDGRGESVQLVPVNRDASSLDQLPDPTWLLAVGEYIEPWFGTRDFPFNPSVRPIFISFHCTEPAVLTPEAITYLHRYGPIGCSDWNTVYLLHGAEVPAFFSGCVTSTLGSIATASQPASDRRVAYVGSPVPRGRKGRHVPVARTHLRDAPLFANLTEALAVLDDLWHGYARIITTSVRCWLAVRSAGKRTKFVPKNPADLRFNGLLELDDAAFDAIRTGVDEKIASTLSLVLSGAEEEEVYAHWRAVCSSDVEAARARIAAVTPLPAPSIDVASVCRRIRSEQVVVPGRATPTVDVAVALDGNLKGPLGVVLEALTTNCSRPLHLWVLCRDHGSADFERMARAFPSVTFTWLPCDRIDYGRVTLLRHITAATLDRLLLPDLLVELDRIVYIDLDVLPLGDVAELHDWDLEGLPLAACTTPFMKTGYANILKLAGFQRRRPRAGDRLLRWMASTHPYDFDRFNAGVLVLDLARMRNDEFTRKFIPFVDEYGFNDQIVLNFYTGADHVSLPAEWNYRPSHDWIESPKLIHWAGPMKPWNNAMAPLAGLWRRYETAYRERVGEIAEGA